MQPVSDGQMLDIARKGVFPRWRLEFLRFVESGDASQQFLEYLDSNQEAKQAAEQAFQIKTEGLEGLAGALAQARAKRQ